MFKVRRVKLMGVSGVVHDVEVAEYKGKRYIVVRLTRSLDNPGVELLSKMIVCFDLQLPPLVITESESMIPGHVRKFISSQGGLIIELKSLKPPSII